MRDNLIDLNSSIIFEDENIVVINKASGIVVNKSDTAKDLITVQSWMEERYGFSNMRAENLTEIEEEFFSRGGVVHRLDKDTSGVLILAKNAKAFLELKNQFKERETVKKYLTLVHGKIEDKMGEVNAPIERSPFNRMHFGVFPGGREAVSKYRVLDYYLRDHEVFSYVEVEPKTGRTHQIRVHMKYLNHSVVSDPIYAGRKLYKKDLEFCPRLFLHAVSLFIVNPTSGKREEYSAPLPAELQAVLDESLRKE